MYNGEVKYAFLGTIENDNSYKVYKSLFVKSEEIERRFGKDIYEMSVDELLVLLDYCSGMKRSSKYVSYSGYRLYIDWCIKNGKTKSENNLEKISVDNIDTTFKFRSNFIKDPEEFESICEDTFPFVDGEVTASNLQMEICFRLAYYHEMSSEEISTLEKDDIDYESGILTRHGGEKIKLDEKLLNAIIDFNSRTTITLINKKNEEIARTYTLDDNNYIIRTRMTNRNSEKSPLSVNSINRIFIKISEKYNESDARSGYKNITPANVNLSHAFYELYSSGEKITEDSKLVPKLENNSAAAKFKVYRSLKTQTEAYESWIKAFYG